MTSSFANELKVVLSDKGVSLVAVSKTKPHEMIMELYDQGFRIFGENRVQELVEKHEALPKEIEWHMIGNLQKNKVKYIAPFVSLIHSVSSEGLLATIQKEAAKNERIIDILLQIKIAEEDSKSGLQDQEITELILQLENGDYPNVSCLGFMGMATFTDDEDQVRREFIKLKSTSDVLVDKHPGAFKDANHLTLSYGMSGDYKIAIEEGSNMVRIGSLIFGAR